MQTNIHLRDVDVHEIAAFYIDDEPLGQYEVQLDLGPYITLYLTPEQTLTIISALTGAQK